MLPVSELREEQPGHAGDGGGRCGRHQEGPVRHPVPRGQHGGEAGPHPRHHAEQIQAARRQGVGDTICMVL